MKLFYGILMAALGFLSCSKDNTSAPTAPTVDSLLIGKTWKIQSITFVSNNILYYYTMGASGNTADFSKDAIVFNKDLTGSYTAGVNTYNITWQFTDAEKSKIKYTILNYDKGLPKSGVNLVVTWENVVLTTSTLKYAEIYTNSDGNSVISSAVRIHG